MATYGSEAGVEALIPAVGDITATSPIDQTELTAWLAQGYARINRAIANAGYQTPVSSGTALYDELTALNNLYAAAYVLRALGIDVTSGETESRSDRWLEEFAEQLKDIAKSDLTAVGATLVASTEDASRRRRRIRSMQLRRVDGFSGAYEGTAVEYDNVSD